MEPIEQRLEIQADYGAWTKEHCFGLQQKELAKAKMQWLKDRNTDLDYRIVKVLVYKVED